MYHYFFGFISMLLLVFILILFSRVFFNINKDKNFSQRRELKKLNKHGNVISLNATLRNDILKEALDINLRQDKLNNDLLSGSFSEDVEDALLQLESDRIENIRRSVEIGLVSENKGLRSINQNST
jgi:hypothetical protein